MEAINHEYYVSLEVAKLLKEAGFDWEYNRYYEFDGKLVWTYFENWNDAMWSRHSTAIYSAPSLDVAQRWLREVHGMHVYVSGFNNYRAYREGSIGATYLTEVFDTYEEAQEAGIKKALEIILEKGE